MSPEDQDKVVAEFMGYRWDGYWLIHPDGKRMHALDGAALPDYGNDLNAMHEVVEWIYPDFSTCSTNALNVWRTFTMALNKAALRDCQEGASRDDRFIMATAAHYREAIVRTLEKWVEPEDAPREQL